NICDAMSKPFKITANRHNAKIWFTKWWAEIGLYFDYDKEYLLVRLFDFKIKGGFTTWNHYREVFDYHNNSVPEFYYFRSCGVHLQITELNITFNTAIRP